jgi:hypothetical protein
MILKCDDMYQEKFLNYEFDSVNIKNFSIVNDDTEVRFVAGKTYLFSTFSPYGHSLVDVYGQYKVLQLKYPDIQPFFFENGEKGYLFNNNKITKDLISTFSDVSNTVFDISKNNYLFEEVIMFFDMNNTFPQNFYEDHGITRSLNYFPFCSCYMGTDVCGQSEYFKYNYLAIDLVIESFSSMFSKNKEKKYFISRERYNTYYKNDIDYFSAKSVLSAEEESQFYRAKIRYCEKEKEIQDIFVKNGYEVIYPEDYGLFDQIKIFSQAKDIASISGASLFNVFWCNYESSITEILAVPGYRYHYKEFADHIGAGHRQILAIDQDILVLEKSLF